MAFGECDEAPHVAHLCLHATEAERRGRQRQEAERLRRLAGEQPAFELEQRLLQARHVAGARIDGEVQLLQLDLFPEE